MSGWCYGGDAATLEAQVDAVVQAVNARVMDHILTKCSLRDHLQTIKKYLLLGQGDAIQYLMDLLGPELSKPALNIFPHNLLGILDTAVRASNPTSGASMNAGDSLNDVNDLLSRVDVRILDATPGDTGWDVFSLDYKVESPLSTILTPRAMAQYQQLFTFLWRLKRVEYGLTALWRRHMNCAKVIHSLPEIAAPVHRCHVRRCAFAGPASLWLACVL